MLTRVRASSRWVTGPQLPKLLPCRRTELLGRLGARDAAADAYGCALDLAGNAAERAFLACRLADTRE
jgi:predicted RNA polymerase sigma factor